MLDARLDLSAIILAIPARNLNGPNHADGVFFAKIALDERSGPATRA
jgi:hypothetical protein